MVIVAGPGVASAIRNQFSTVTDAIGSGTVGENFYDAVDLPDPQNGTAFAVYSEDDHSLMFYKRRGVPQVGDMFNYRRVTEVYTGIETAANSIIGSTQTCSPGEEWRYYKTDVPWFGIREEIESVKVIDAGIAPKSMAWWFYRCSNVKTVDVSNFDARQTVSVSDMFLLGSKLEKVYLPSFTLSLCSMADFASNCPELTTLKIPSSDFSNVDNLFHCFSADPKLMLDCSEWNVKADASHINFNYNSPGVVLPSVWR